MTYPPPYSRQFQVPPYPGQGPTVDLATLPPIPPRPRALKRGLYLLGASGAVYVICAVWNTIAAVAALDAGDGAGETMIEAVSPILSILLVCAVIGVLTYFLWRGSRIALGLAVAWVLLDAFTLLTTGIRFAAVLVRDGSPRAFFDELLGHPYEIGYLLAVLVGLASLLGFADRACRSWTRKVDAIRWVRGRVERGAPLLQVPPAVYE